MESRYAHITFSERAIIRTMLGRKCSRSKIARLLGKHRSTVCREMRRNTNGAGIYFEKHAEARMLKRRKEAKQKALIIENDIQLEGYVCNLLQRHLSPEQVAGYMRRSGYARPLCHKTIYSSVHRKWQSRKAFLRFKGKPRVKYGERKRAWQPHKRHISERPALVEKRERIGDWEGDLVHGTQDDSRHCLLTLNERWSGFCIIWKVASLNPFFMARLIPLALKNFPVHTITFDNGIEFGQHRTIERLLKCRVYFTDTNSPEQRGANENLNGLIREFFPKGHSLAHVRQPQATYVAQLLNGRPRKRLGYDCPRNVLARLSGRNPFSPAFKGEY
jgi:IS30 family transposase